MEEGNIEYLVKLKYAKPVQLPVVRTQKIAEFMPVFELKDGKVTGKVEGRARVFLPDFLNFAKHLGFEVSGKKRIKLRTRDDYAYLRLFVYAMAMSLLRNPNDWGKLEDHVLSMDPISLRYWASKFKSAYWRYRDRRKVAYLAKRFLEVEWF